MDLNALRESIAHNDTILSRTAQSSSTDTSASASKLKSRLSGTDLAKAMDENRGAVVEYILGCPICVLQSGHDLFASILTLANLTNRKILPAGLFRTWRLPEGRKYGSGPESKEIPVSEIWSSLDALCEHSIDLLSNGNDAIKIAATLEWHIGIGPLHPFYDGCGRISRSVGALILQQNTLPNKRHQSREDYFMAGAAGLNSFSEYYTALPNF